LSERARWRLVSIEQRTQSLDALQEQGTQAGQTESRTLSGRHRTLYLCTYSSRVSSDTTTPKRARELSRRATTRTGAPERTGMFCGFVFLADGFQRQPNVSRIRTRARVSSCQQNAWSSARSYLRAYGPPQSCRRLVRRRRHPRRVDRGAATPPNPCAHFEVPRRAQAIACARVFSGATRFYRVARAVRAHCRDAQPPRLTRHMPLLFAHADVMAMVVEASTRRGRSGRTRARRTTTPRRACRSRASHGATQQVSSSTARPAAPPS
jgi:hypothetical protein